MPSYRITGGPTGDAGVNYKNTRAEVGDVVDDLPRESVKWLRDQGYIELIGKDDTPADPAPADPAPADPAPAPVDSTPAEEVAPS